MLLKQYQRYILIAVPIIIVGLLIYYFSDIFTYVALGWVLSLLGAPLYRLFNKVLSSNLSATITLFSFTIIIALLVWLVVPPIVKQTRNLAKIDYDSIVKSLDEPLKDWNNWLVQMGLVDDPSDISDSSLQNQDKKHPTYDIVEVDTTTESQINIFIDLNELPDNTTATDSGKPEDISDAMRKNVMHYFNPKIIPSLFGSVAGFFGNLLITILSTFFITFFFLKEKGLFTKMIKSVIPNHQEERAEHAISESENLLIRYFLGIALQITVITTILGISLRLFGYENALLIAFVTALMNVIPYVGPILGGIFGIIITISSNVEAPFYSEVLPAIIKLIPIFAAMQLIDNFLVQPNIFSKSVKAHPLEIFIVVLMGAKLGGVLGMLLAIPIYTVIRVLAKVFLSEFKIVKSVTRDM